MQQQRRSALLLTFLACCIGIAHVLNRSVAPAELEEWGVRQQQLVGTETDVNTDLQDFQKFITAWSKQHPGAKLDEEQIAWDAWQAARAQSHAATTQTYPQVQVDASAASTVHAALPDDDSNDIANAANVKEDKRYWNDGVVHKNEHTDRSAEGAASFVDSQFQGMEEPPVPAFARTPETIIAAPPGPPDFNGADAIVAAHPFVGDAPTELQEHHSESRGSFTVRLARTGWDQDGEVALAIWGPSSPFKCTIRGYRQLSDDFQGNSVFTGFKKSWAGQRKINTGYISAGVQGEYDMLTCRDETTGEAQYFRFSYGGKENNDLIHDPPVPVLGPHFGMNTDAVDFDMDKPTFEDYEASHAWYEDYDPLADIKPFS